jgi:hypothetical protein
MYGINSLVRFPITYVADGESKLLDAFPVAQKINNGKQTMIYYRLN